jgi:MFS family permease
MSEFWTLTKKKKPADQLQTPGGRTGIPRTVWALGFVSMFMDISSEMIHSLLPVFLVSVLNATATQVGLIEGLAEATALITRGFSGTLSDWLGKRKGLAVAGYALGTLTKPLFAIASGIGLVFTARFLDRLGKGIRGAPRDALVADVTLPQHRGAAYGLRQSLDTVGAFLGPVAALLLMAATSGEFRTVFWVAVAPGLLAVAILTFAVREPQTAPKKSSPQPMHFRDLGNLGSDFWIVVGVGSVFNLARFSEAFLLLRAEEAGIAAGMVPIVFIVMNIFYALSAYPVGHLSDHIGRTGLMAGGLLLMIASDLTLAYAESGWQVLGGAALWGLHMGLTQGLLAALVAETARKELRGTAFGLFNMAGGVAMLFASLMAGVLWDLFGAKFTFLTGAFFAMAALAGFLSFSRRVTSKH